MFLDIFIIIVVVLAVFHGWNNGLLRELVSLGGFLLGFIVACLCYSQFGTYLQVQGTTLNVILNIVAFFIIWIIVPIVCGFVASVLTAGLRHIPLVGCSNKIGGLVISLAKYLLLMSFALNAMSSLNILNRSRTSDSYLYNPVSSITGIVKDVLVGEATSTYAGIDSEAGDTNLSDTIWIEVDKNNR